MFTHHLIHLSNDEIVCLPWRFGRPLAERRFATGEAGIEAFTAYLRAWQNVPTRIVVDLIEEDFRVETLPHLRGRDRRVVLERRLTQLYRATPFRMAVLQGREAAGRRDDIALCTAITQNASLVACLDALGRWRIPVLGVHPAALLGESLLRSLRIQAEQLVLVTLLRRDTLRISFFQQGRLRFSRISQPLAEGRADLVGELREEVRRTLQYVGAQPWFMRSMAVRTLLVADDPDAQALSAVWSDSDSTLQVVSPRTVARRLGLRRMPQQSNATGLLLHLLMKQPPAEQLAPPERTRDGRLWYARTSLFGLSALVAAVAVLLALADVLSALEVRADSLRVASALAARREEIALAQRQLPTSEVSPDRMSALVRFENNEVQAVPRMLPFLQRLAGGLERTPGVRLRSVVWTVGTRPPQPDSLPAVGANGTAVDPRGMAGPISGLSHHRFYQDVRIEGEADTTDPDPGRQLEGIERLVQGLRAPDLDVRLARAPYDFRPVSPLASRNLGATSRAPVFVLHAYSAGAP